MARAGRDREPTPLRRARQAHNWTLEDVCEIYALSADVLFAHQDEGLGRLAAVQLLAGFPDLQRAMARVVSEAEKFLIVMGSRSRDVQYLRAIEVALEQRPMLICYRVLFGPPHHQILKDHLLRLLNLRALAHLMGSGHAR